MEIGFEPLTIQMGITGTSYGLQIGLINEKWVVRLFKGKETLKTRKFKENELVQGLPDPNIIVSWTLGAIITPNINPVTIKRVVELLLNEAKKNKDKKKVVAPIKEAIEKKLKHVPKSELKISHLKKTSCLSCGHQIKYCPSCGTMFIKGD
ncbi:MAG: hypothetical protein ACW986_19155 [Promethearchaeota archaeon]|jgi:hypothetical protein